MQSTPFQQTPLVAEAGQSRPHPATAVEEPRSGALIPLYVTFGALQSLDVHSTLRARRAGAVEQNPLMKDVVNNPAALVAVKTGVGAATILLAEKLRKRNRVGAVVLMAAVNSAYATVVARNYAIR